MKRIANFIAGLVLLALSIVFIVGVLSAFHLTPLEAASYTVHEVYQAGTYMGKIMQQPAK